MWYYVKTLEYPVNLKSSDLKMAKLLITQYGGPDGELGAALQIFKSKIFNANKQSKRSIN